ncbi:MAG: LacI family DNA-binding transcriptional regulator [Clostridium sp.]|nr:LacI family DNA-binding transcriptional regulator [Clostridium sp.]
MVTKNVTMSDVAKDMGVSTVTVSKAITGKDGVSKEVREKILKRAEELGYVYTKGLKDNRAHKQYNIGVLVAGNFMSTDAFYSNLYQRITMELIAQGHFGILEIVTKQAENENVLPNVLVNHKVDGIIMMGQMSQAYIEKIRETGVPLIFMDFELEDMQVDSIISDGMYGACMMTRYLIAQGHKKIGYIGSYQATSSIMDRYMGFRKAMLQAGIPVREEWVIPDRDEDGVYVEPTFPKEMPTAFVCNCDEVAFHVITKLKKLGYKVPGDISVVGFDNYIYAELSLPRITTFGVQTDVMVKSTVDTIIHKLNDPDYSVGCIVISGEVYVRDSVKKL